MLDEEREFEQILADKKHEELLAALGHIFRAVNQEHPDNSDKIVDAIAKNGTIIESFLKKSEKLSQPVDNQSNKEILTSMKSMANDIVNGLNEVKKELSTKKIKELKIHRDAGVIESVSVIY